MKSKSAFTLIEIMLYVSLVTLILTSIVTLGWNIITAGTKSATQQEVSDAARFILQVIKSEIRNSDSVTSVTPSVLTLATFTPSTNPTVIDLNSGQIRIKRGGGLALPLNPASTTVTSLVFTDYSTAGGAAAVSQNVGFTFTLQSAYTGPRQEYKTSLTATASAEVRSHQPN